MMQLIEAYQQRLNDTMAAMDWTPVTHLSEALLVAVQQQRNVFLCGNGGQCG